ncbi:Hypothetical protein GbCGDNIH3_1462 [Granulibacter bethesdensis]|uniref:DUF2147 domain-containing protein n=2 Tax=Granulibacter bethesdensis TaxID=364410 RepID=A0AAN0REC0_9PROT|nr:Hypothetical protein GbCGDNIH3_1462 [Granulibacter bethesdensis]
MIRMLSASCLNHMRCRLLQGAFMAALILLPCLGWSAEPDPLLGPWLTQDREAVIELVQCKPRSDRSGQSGLCGRIAGITLDHPDDPMPVDVWGRPQCGETIIETGPRDADGRWPGKILDPRKGSWYSVSLWIGPDGNLRVRGYIGISLFGETQSWTRYHGRLRTDCLMQRMAKAD